MKYVNATVLSAVDTASQNGTAIDSSQIVTASFQCTFGDASANGTLKIQASNDLCFTGNNPGTFIPTHWVDIPNATASITSGSSALISIDFVCYRWMRVVYTRSSGGSSTIMINMNAVCA